MILMVSFHSMSTYITLKIFLSLFPPSEKKKKKLKKKYSTQSIWHLKSKYYKDILTAFFFIKTWTSDLY